MAQKKAEKVETVKVYSPNRTYTGVSAGIHFANGVGEIANDSPLIEWFESKGYTVGEPPEVEPAKDANPQGVTPAPITPPAE